MCKVRPDLFRFVFFEGIMSDIQIAGIDKKTRDQARLYYFGDYELGDICEILNIDIDTLRFYIYGEDETGNNEHCWHQLKKQLKPTAIAFYVKEKIGALEKTAGMAHKILGKSLNDLYERMNNEEQYQLNVSEMKVMADIATQLDKIVRLESNKPTEISEFVTLSVQEARRILAEDPFLNPLDIPVYDYVEVHEEIEEVVVDKAPWDYEEKVPSER